MPGPAALNSAETVAAADPDRRRSLIDDLLLVRERAAGAAIRVADVIETLRGRGPAMLMLLLSLPFVVPLPVPGLSVPLGAAIMLYGITVTFRMRPWVPGFVRNRTLPYALLDKIVSVASGPGRRVEVLLRPRMRFMLWPAVDVLIGLSIAFDGWFLALPLPIPLTNAIPAIGLILLLLGMIERDGVFVLLGQLVTLLILAGCVYVGYLFWTYGFHKGWEIVRHGFHHLAATRPATLPTTFPATMP